MGCTRERALVQGARNHSIEGHRAEHGWLPRDSRAFPRTTSNGGGWLLVISGLNEGLVSDHSQRTGLLIDQEALWTVGWSTNRCQIGSWNGKKVEAWHYLGDMACVALGSQRSRSYLAIQRLAQDVFLAEFNLLFITVSPSKCFLPSGEASRSPTLMSPSCMTVLSIAHVFWLFFTFPMTTWETRMSVVDLVSLVP